jgi:hypothetical protein
MPKDINSLSSEIAQAIISSLEAGTVPIGYSQYYDVGRRSQNETVRNEIEENSSKLRFINGDYGTGKTHFLSAIRNWAIQNEYSASHVILSPRGAPLYNLEAVYSRILKNLVFEDQDVSSPIEAVLEFVFLEFKKFLSEYMKLDMPQCEKFHMNPLYCSHCNQSGNVEEMYIKDFRKLDTNLQIAIIVYRWARWGYNPDFETADLVIRWLEGERLYRTQLNYLGIWDRIGRGDILKGVNEISKLVSLLNKKGMIIMLDEAEGIESLMPSQKPIAYENLKFLIEGAKNNENIYFLYATTPTFYNDVNDHSIELSNLVKNTACTDLAPLSPKELEDLAFKIAHIFEIALGESAEKKDFANIGAIIRENIDIVHNLKLSVRDFVVEIITLLQNL